MRSVEDIYLAGKELAEDNIDNNKIFLALLEDRTDSQVQEFLDELNLTMKIDIGKFKAEAFVSAAKVGNLRALIRLMDSGVSGNVFTEDNTTALIEAASNGKLEVVELLLSRRVNINITGNNGVTPLLAAVQKGHIKIVEMLLSSGARTDIADRRNSDFPLLSAARCGNIEIIDLLLKSGAAIDQVERTRTNVLLAAVFYNKPDVVSYILSQDDLLLNQPDSFGLTPLHLASINGYVAILESLLSAGANMHSKEFSNGNSCLHYAAINNKANIIEVLVSKGDYVSKVNYAGETALFLAVNHNCFDAVSALLSRGALDDLEEFHKLGILHTAISKGFDKIVRLLVEQIDPSSCDMDGRDALDVALTSIKLEKNMYPSIKESFITIIKILVDEMKVPVRGAIREVVASYIKNCDVDESVDLLAAAAALQSLPVPPAPLRVPCLSGGGEVLAFQHTYDSASSPMSNSSDTPGAQVTALSSKSHSPVTPQAPVPLDSPRPIVPAPSASPRPLDSIGSHVALQPAQQEREINPRRELDSLQSPSFIGQALPDSGSSSVLQLLLGSKEFISTARKNAAGLLLEPLGEFSLSFPCTFAGRVSPSSRAGAGEGAGVKESGLVLHVQENSRKRSDPSSNGFYNFLVKAGEDYGDKGFDNSHQPPAKKVTRG